MSKSRNSTEEKTEDNVEEICPPNAELIPNTIEEKNNVEIKVYRKRWFMVVLYFLFGFSNSIQWIQFTIISNISRRYFNVSNHAIEWTAFVNNVAGLVLIYPLSYFNYKVDLRYAVVTASIVICVAAWIKALAISPDHYVAILIAQSMIGCWEIVLMPSCAVLAAYWFGPEQISTANALNNIGITVGLATMSILTPMLVKNHKNVNDITTDFHSLLLGVAIYCTLITLAIIIFFENEPKVPPSKSRQLQKEHRKKNFIFWKSIRSILTNRNFIILCIAHGIHVAAVTNIVTLFNSLYLPHFPNEEEDVGRIYLLIMIVGLIGRVVFGRIQDKWKKFKVLSVFLYFCTIIAEVLLAISLHMNAKWAVYVTAAFLGFVALAYTTTGYETCIESIYPESEAICVIVLNAASQNFGILLLIVNDKVVQKFGDTGAHVSATVLLIIGLIFNASAADVQRRHCVDSNSNYDS